MSDHAGDQERVRRLTGLSARVTSDEITDPPTIPNPERLPELRVVRDKVAIVATDIPDGQGEGKIYVFAQFNSATDFRDALLSLGHEAVLSIEIVHGPEATARMIAALS